MEDSVSRSITNSYASQHESVLVKRKSFEISGADAPHTRVLDFTSHSPLLFANSQPFNFGGSALESAQTFLCPSIGSLSISSSLQSISDYQLSKNIKLSDNCGSPTSVTDPNFLHKLTTQESSQLQCRAQIPAYPLLRGPSISAPSLTLPSIFGTDNTNISSRHTDLSVIGEDANVSDVEGQEDLMCDFAEDWSISNQSLESEDGNNYGNCQFQVGTDDRLDMNYQGKESDMFDFCDIPELEMQLPSFPDFKDTYEGCVRGGCAFYFMSVTQNEAERDLAEFFGMTGK